MEKGERDKKYEPVNLPEKLKGRILSVVDSKDMRDYLSEDFKFNIFNLTDLIGSSPRPMDLKIDLLMELMGVHMEEEAFKYLEGCFDEASAAMLELYKMDPDRSVLLAYDMHSEYIDSFADYAVPCRSYEDFLDYAREEIWEEDGPLEEQSDLQENYYRLVLFDVTDGKYKKVTTYFCAPNGKVQYYRREHSMGRPSERDYEQERMEESFAGEAGLYWTAPYKVGDILYVDMRPYFKPTYCLIDWINEEWPFDCCGIQCLYLGAGGLVAQAPLKHGRFLPHLLSDPCSFTRLFYSPLYRAERFEGELPEEYAFMKTVSERLKEDLGMSQKIDGFFVKDWNGKAARFVYRPVRVVEPDWDDEDPELDVVWHPERKGREWWEDDGWVDGITKERLLEIAGCSETAGSEAGGSEAGGEAGGSSGSKNEED